MMSRVEDMQLRLLPEIDAYACVLNKLLKGNKLASHLLPLSLGGYDLVEKVYDGLLLSCLFAAIPNQTVLKVEELNLNRDKRELGFYQCFENHTLLLNAVRSAGIKLVNIGEDDLMDGMKHINLVLALTRILIKFHRISSLSFSDIETGHQRILSFANDALERANRGDLKISSFSKLGNEALSILLSETDSTRPSIEKSFTGSSMEKASELIGRCSALGIDSFIRPEDMVNGNEVLIFDLVASLYSFQNKRSQNMPSMDMIDQNEYVPQNEIKGKYFISMPWECCYSSLTPIKDRNTE